MPGTPPERKPLHEPRTATPIDSDALGLLAVAFLRARVCTILMQMLVADAYRPDQWHDFFITVGGAAAAVTGLVFVALSLNLEVVTRDATHRYRAIGTLMNFAGIFVLCALALMGGQNHLAIGAEWLIVSSSFCGVFVHGFLRARSDGGTQTTPSLVRTMVGTTFYVAQITGSVVLLFDATAGLYIAAVAMVILGAYSVSGAWLLLVSAHQDERGRSQG